MLKLLLIALSIVVSNTTFAADLKGAVRQLEKMSGQPEGSVVCGKYFAFGYAGLRFEPRAFFKVIGGTDEKARKGQVKMVSASPDDIEFLPNNKGKVVIMALRDKRKRIESFIVSLPPEEYVLVRNWQTCLLGMPAGVSS